MVKQDRYCITTVDKRALLGNVTAILIMIKTYPI